MKDLTKTEEILLIAIWKLGDEAYGVTIKDEVKKITGRKYLYSTLYTTLEQLVSKKYIKKRYGDPSPVRGGKRKIFFDMTKSGIKALEKAYNKQKNIWDGIKDSSFEKGAI